MRYSAFYTKYVKGSDHRLSLHGMGIKCPRLNPGCLHWAYLFVSLCGLWLGNAAELQKMLCATSHLVLALYVLLPLQAF